MTTILEKIEEGATQRLESIRASANPVDKRLGDELNKQTEYSEQEQVSWLMGRTRIGGSSHWRYQLKSKLLLHELAMLQGVDPKTMQSHKLDAWLKRAEKSTVGTSMHIMFLLLLKKTGGDREKMKKILTKNPHGRTGLTLWEWIQDGNTALALTLLHRRTQ